MSPRLPSPKASTSVLPGIVVETSSYTCSSSRCFYLPSSWLLLPLQWKVRTPLSIFRPSLFDHSSHHHRCSGSKPTQNLKNHPLVLTVHLLFAIPYDWPNRAQVLFAGQQMSSDRYTVPYSSVSPSYRSHPFYRQPTYLGNSSLSLCLLIPLFLHLPQPHHLNQRRKQPSYFSFWLDKGKLSFFSSSAFRS